MKIYEKPTAGEPFEITGTEVGQTIAEYIATARGQGLTDTDIEEDIVEEFGPDFDDATVKGNVVTVMRAESVAADADAWRQEVE